MLFVCRGGAGGRGLGGGGRTRLCTGAQMSLFSPQFPQLLLTFRPASNALPTAPSCVSGWRWAKRPVTKDKLPSLMPSALAFISPHPQAAPCTQGGHRALTVRALLTGFTHYWQSVSRRPVTMLSLSLPLSLSKAALNEVDPMHAHSLAHPFCCPGQVVMLMPRILALSQS